MTQRSEAFHEANKRNPVIAGEAIGDGGKGAIYTLFGGEKWRLNTDDCRALPRGYPRWMLPK